MGLAVKIVVARHRAGVKLVCFDDDDRILFLRHVFHPEAPWDLPGGWLDRNESPAECALRELGEETGLEAVLGPVVQITRESFPAHIGITYMARLSSVRTEPILSPEILEATWLALDELPEGLRTTTRLAIDTAVDNLSIWSMTEQLRNV